MRQIDSSFLLVHLPLLLGIAPLPAMGEEVTPGSFGRLAGSWFNADTGAPQAGPTTGNDLFVGDAGNDIGINSGGGYDVLYGNDGDDDLDGSSDHDLLIGGPGADTLTGQSGNDILFGGADSDILDGGSGDDILVGGGGSDTMDGGNDDDLFLFTGAQDGDVYTVDGGNHANTIDVSEFGVGNVTLGAGTITVDLGDGESFVINHTNVPNIVLAEDGGNHAPQADAGPDQSVDVFSVVTLDASASSDPDPDVLTYDWQQIEGTWVTLSDSTAVSPTFTAPSSADVLKFAVTVSDGVVRDVATVMITVNAGMFVDLSLDKGVDNPTPSVGDTITYTVTVVNNGPDDATEVEVTDLLPAAVSFVADSVSQGSYDPQSGLWVVGAIPNGANATLFIWATVDGP